MRVVQQKLSQTILSGMVLTFLVSVVMATVTAQPAGALSLKDTVQQVTQPLNTLLGPVKNQLVKPQPSQPQQSTTPTSGNSSASTPASAPSTPTSQSGSADSSAAPATTNLSEVPVMDTTPLEQILPISRKFSVDASDRPNLASIFLKNSGSSGAPAPVTDFGMFEATESGWRVLGMLWYWWVGIIGAISVASWVAINWFRAHSRV